MNRHDAWIWALAGAVGVVLVLLILWRWEDKAACDAVGGVYARTLTGYECVPPR